MVWNVPIVNSWAIPQNWKSFSLWDFWGLGKFRHVPNKNSIFQKVLQMVWNVPRINISAIIIKMYPSQLLRVLSDWSSLKCFSPRSSNLAIKKSGLFGVPVKTDNNVLFSPVFFGTLIKLIVSKIYKLHVRCVVFDAAHFGYKIESPTIWCPSQKCKKKRK